MGIALLNLEDWMKAAAYALIAGCALSFGACYYYLSKINVEVRSRLSGSGWDLLRGWFLGPFYHARYYPQGGSRRKLVASLVATAILGYLGFLAWMKAAGAHVPGK
jgi:hypothetical protein